MAYMSQEGYDKLVAELKQLTTVERPKASAAIAEARDKGDLSENSEYDAAKEAQHRQRADYVEGGDDQHGKQGKDDLYHRERKRGQLEGRQDFHQDPNRTRLAQQEGGRCS